MSLDSGAQRFDAKQLVAACANSEAAVGNDLQGPDGQEGINHHEAKSPGLVAAHPTTVLAILAAVGAVAT